MTAVIELVEQSFAVELVQPVAAVEIVQPSTVVEISENGTDIELVESQTVIELTSGATLEMVEQRTIIEIGGTALQGPAGPDGPAGAAGATGPAGPIGPTGPAGTTDHSLLINLAADGHTQYHTDARGDARYAPLAHVGSGGAAHALAVAAGASGFLSGADKTKLDGVAAGAEVNVNADWTAVSGDAHVLNKPASFPPAAHLHAQTDVTGLPEIWAATKEPTGFESPELITQTYASVTRTVTLTQSGGIPYWYRGVRYVLASPWTSAAHAVTVGTWFLRFAGTAFTWAQTLPALESEGPVCYVDYDSPLGTTFAIREIHGLMAWQTHLELHERIGTYRRSGGGPTAGTYALNTDSALAITPGFDAAVVADEDLQSTIAALPEGSYMHMRIGAGSVVAFRVAQPYLTYTTPTTGLYPMVNNVLTGAETEAATGDFLNVYQILMPVTSDAGSQVYRMLFLQPQAVHGSLAMAQAEDYGALSLGNLLGLSTEFVPYSRMTFRVQAANTTVGKVQLVGLSYLSGSRVSVSSPGGISPHAPTHAAAGSDPLIIAQSQVTSLTTDLAGKVSKSGDTMTGVLTIDRGSSALPGSWTTPPARGIVLAGADGSYADLNAVSFGGSGLMLRGAVAGGVRSAPLAVADDAYLVSKFGGGYDGANWAEVARETIRTDGAWSAINHGVKFVWDGCPNNSLVTAEWMRLQNGMLSLTGVTPVAGNGKLQIPAGTTKADGIAFGTDTFLYRGAAGELILGGQGTTSKVRISGAASGLNDGAFIGVSNGASSVIYIGNHSAVIGGAYDAAAVLYANGPLRIIIGAGIAVTVTPAGLFQIQSIADGALSVPGRITAKAAVPASFADLAAVRAYLSSILT